MAKTITSANSIFLLGITGLYPTAQLLQGYMADAAFDVDATDVSEIVLGVDGNMSYGWVPRTYTQTISLMPDSSSSTLFEDWSLQQDAAQEVFPAFGSITIPGLQRQYVLANGVLKNIKAIPGAKKVLEGRPFMIVWNNITPQPYLP